MEAGETEMTGRAVVKCEVNLHVKSVDRRPNRSKVHHLEKVSGCDVVVEVVSEYAR